MVKILKSKYGSKSESIFLERNTFGSFVSALVCANKIPESIKNSGIQKEAIHVMRETEGYWE